VRSTGAKGDGTTDDTTAIQLAIEKVSLTGGTVAVPAGTYMVDAVRGVELASRVTLRLDPRATLKAIPNDRANHSILRMSNVTKANVIGGALIGERHQHGGTTGEWGMGITISGSEQIVIEELTISNMWGDGIYINKQSRNVKICAVTSDSNRRQGLSVISVDGLEVAHSTFSNTSGTDPAAGIDLEPNLHDTIDNVRIHDSRFFNNDGAGILITAAHSPIRGVILERNMISSNRGPGISVFRTSGHRIIENVITGNRGPAVLLSRGSKSNSTSRNQISGTGIRDDGDNSVFSNTTR
jgi:parallel beta-helix repeat protein